MRFHIIVTSIILGIGLVATVGAIKNRKKECVINNQQIDKV
jgi:hypothetical protein